jgi:hypothetical protein
MLDDRRLDDNAAISRLRRRSTAAIGAASTITFMSIFTPCRARMGPADAGPTAHFLPPPHMTAMMPRRDQTRRQASINIAYAALVSHAISRCAGAGAAGSLSARLAPSRLLRSAFSQYSSGYDMPNDSHKRRIARPRHMCHRPIFCSRLPAAASVRITRSSTVSLHTADSIFSVTHI